MKRLKGFIKMKIEQFLMRTFDVELKVLWELEVKIASLEEDYRGLKNKVKRLDKDVIKLQLEAEKRQN